MNTIYTYINWSLCYNSSIIIKLTPKLKIYNILSSLVIKHNFYIPNYFSIIEFNLYFIIVFFYFLIFFKKFNIFNHIKFLEKEFSSINDLIHVIFIICGFFFNILFINFNWVFNVEGLFSYFIVIKLLIGFVVLHNVIFLYNCGFHFISYVKGSGYKQLFTYELIYDFINILSFFLRSIIQTIRIFIIIILYYTFYHAIIDHIYFYNLVDFSGNSSFDSVLLGYIWVFIEYLHILVLILVQLSAFFIMLFWLFQFLFTTFCYNDFENKKF